MHLDIGSLYISGFSTTAYQQQRSNIAHVYNTVTQISLFYFNLQDLIEDIKSELSGDYKDAILACFVSPAYYDARSIKKAIYVSIDFVFP